MMMCCNVTASQTIFSKNTIFIVQKYKKNNALYEPYEIKNKCTGCFVVIKRELKGNILPDI